MNQPRSLFWFQTDTRKSKPNYCHPGCLIVSCYAVSNIRISFPDTTYEFSSFRDSRLPQEGCCAMVNMNTLFDACYPFLAVVSIVVFRMQFSKDHSPSNMRSRKSAVGKQRHLEREQTKRQACRRRPCLAGNYVPILSINISFYHLFIPCH
jgi:hypothetical protein